MSEQGTPKVSEHPVAARQIAQAFRFQNQAGVDQVLLGFIQSSLINGANGAL